MPLRREPDTVSPRALARVRGRGRHRPVEVPRGPVFELPQSLQGARWVPSRSAVASVLAVVALVAVVFGVRVWLAGADGGTAVGQRGGVGGAGGVGAAPSGVSRGTSTLSRASPDGSVAVTPSASAGASAGAAAAGLVVVHVVGQVAGPGVYRLRAGARVGDAVTAAGGATRAADLAAVNLARVLVDGEQIHVPRPGEVVAGPVAGGSGPSGGSGGGTGSSGSTGDGAKVSLNSADLAALDTLPGVGPVLAQRILDWRAEHGRFTTIDELGEVSGIGEKVLAQLTPRVTL